MISHLQMITIYVSDLERALAFYVDQLGFTRLAEYDDGQGQRLIWVIPAPASQDERATEIALFAAADPADPRIGSASGMVFTAADVQATYDELKARGVTFVQELIRHNTGAGDGDQEAQFVDPDGNRFLLHT